MASGPQAWTEMELFERLCGRTADNEMDTSAGPVRITTSIGVATSLPSDTVDSIVARADSALYRAKREGRNRVVFETA